MLIVECVVVADVALAVVVATAELRVAAAVGVLLPLSDYLIAGSAGCCCCCWILLVLILVLLLVLV